MQGINILGSGTFVPENIMTNNDFAEIVETSDEWITTRTGIKQRHISTGEPTWYLGAMAAKKALVDADVTASEIDLIIFATVTADFYFPSMSCMLQREIGANNAMTIDIGCACSGFVYGIDMARRYLAFDDVNKVLVVGAENLSKILDYSDRTTCILFGDGASAFVLEASDKAFSSFLGADGNGARYLVSRHIDTKTRWYREEGHIDDKLPCSDKQYLIQDGREVYKFATKILPFAAEKALAKLSLKPEDIDWYVPHQANLRIIQTAAAHLGVSMEKFIVTMEKYGNTSSSSIPIAFDESVKNGIIKRGDKICFVGFGAGLTYGAAVFEF